MKEIKESVLDVLMFLFENYQDAEVADTENHESLREELAGAGFPDAEILHAFAWLDGLEERRRQLQLFGSRQTLRIYTREEQARLHVESRGFLMYLEQLGILTAATRELAIDRMMDLDEDVDLERAKWVLLLVLMNQPDGAEAFGALNDLVGGDAAHLH